MRPTIIIIILFISLFVGCDNNKQNESSNLNTVSKDTSGLIKPLPNAGLTIKWKKENWFTVAYQPLCDDRKGLLLDYKKFKKYGKHNPYDTIQKIIKDTTIVTFDFISDCCIEYSGEALIRDDVLYLAYGPATPPRPCDCYCNYRMIYKIHTRNIHWKKVVIQKDRIL